MFQWKAIKIFSALAGASFVLFVDPPAHGNLLGSAGPVIIEARHLERFLGTPLNTLALRCIKAGRIQALPFQIDTRICTKTGNEERCTYVLEDPSGSLEISSAPLCRRDELVFMASDGGECGVPPKGIDSAHIPFPPLSHEWLEIRIEDPETGNQVCVYLGRTESDLPEQQGPEVDYDPSLDIITSRAYRLAFDPENPYFWKTLSLKGEKGPAPLLADEGVLSQVSHAKGLVVYEVNRSDIRSERVGHRAGPVRVIRVTRNRVRIGPFLWKETIETGVFYRDQFHTSFHSGTYLHQRLLVEERQKFFTALTPSAAGWEWRNGKGQIQGLVDGRVSPEERASQTGESETLILAGEAGTLVYRLCCQSPGKPDRPLFRQSYLEEGKEAFASAGMCIPNLQDSLGPRQRFVKSLFFLPSGRCRDRSTVNLPQSKPLNIWVGSREISQTVPSSCWPALPPDQEKERELREACLPRAPGRGPDRRWGIVPVISAGPDKGLGFGLKYRHLGPFKPNHPLEARFLYTIYQYQIAEFWYFANAFPSKRSGVRLACNYYNKTRARFYGIGNDTEEAAVADFTWQDLDLSLVLDHRLPWGFGLLAGWEARVGNIGEGKDSDLPPLESVHPEVFGAEGGWANGPVLGIYHTTLSSPTDPLSGGMQSFTVSLSDDSMGSYTYQRYRLEAIQVIPLPAYTHGLALRGQVQVIEGDPPFTLLSWVGGDDTARGYFEGRYRDRDRILFNAEYRCNLYKFFDGVLFLDTGMVARDLLRSSPLKDLHVTGGFGMRFHLHPDLIVRFDVGFSGEMTAAYLNFGHAF